MSANGSGPRTTAVSEPPSSSAQVTGPRGTDADVVRAEIAGLGRELVARACEGGVRIALAESLTGGLVADAIIQVPGASAVLRGAIVAYASDLKGELLGVDPDLLETVGAVDADVAAQMAQGAVVRLGADLGLSTTGVAGPEGQDGKPAGLVFVAVASTHGVPTVRELALSGDREMMRLLSVRAVLELALEVGEW